MDDDKKRSLTETEKELKDKAKNLQDEISKQEQELKQVQDACKHPKESLKFTSSEGGSSNLRVICEVCNKILRYPSTNDLEENGYK